MVFFFSLAYPLKIPWPPDLLFELDPLMHLYLLVSGEGFLNWIFLLAAGMLLIALLVVMPRLYYVLTAVALDRSTSLMWAWNDTRGNTGRPFIIMVAVILPPIVILGLLSPPAEISPSGALTATMSIMVAVFSIIIWAVMVLASSFAYRRLSLPPMAPPESQDSDDG